MYKRIRQIVLLGTITVLSLGIGSAVVAYAGSAGSDQDPLVTLSYIEKRIQEVTVDLTSQIADLKKQIGSQPGSSGGTGESAVFQVVRVEKGSFIYFGGGTEFILRSGAAAAITTPAGGLSDLTDGKDISMGQSIQANHHILVPRDDGRGLGVMDISFIMIKGPYTITQ